MTDIVPIPPAPTVPQYPALGSSTFNQEAYTYATAMPGVTASVREIAQACWTCATASKESAQAALDARTAVALDLQAVQQLKADVLLAKQAAEQAEANAAESASEANQSKLDSASYASDSADSATAANWSKLDAADSAAAADQAKVDAQKARDDAQVFATQQIQGSSTTSVTPGAGAKSLTIEANRSFVVGMYVVATSTSDPATSMSGYVQSYNPTTGDMVIGVDMFSGASAKADWVIGIAAPGAASGLTRQIVTTNTTCVAGVAYIVAAAGITITLPATWVPGDKIGIIEAIGDGAQYTQVWGSTKLRGRTIGTQLLTAVFGSTGVLTYQDSTRGLV